MLCFYCLIPMQIGTEAGDPVSVAPTSVVTGRASSISTNDTAAAVDAVLDGLILGVVSDFDAEAPAFAGAVMDDLVNIVEAAADTTAAAVSRGVVEDVSSNVKVCSGTQLCSSTAADDVTAVLACSEATLMVCLTLHLQLLQYIMHLQAPGHCKLVYAALCELVKAACHAQAVLTKTNNQQGRLAKISSYGAQPSLTQCSSKRGRTATLSTCNGHCLEGRWTVSPLQLVRSVLISCADWESGWGSV